MIKNSIVTSTILLVAGVSALTATADQLYRWADQSGKISFTDSSTPPSPDHHLVETKNYTPTPIENQEQGLFRLEELRTYNLEHPLPSAMLKDTSSEPIFSKVECDAAIRHYEIESGSLTRTKTSVATAETLMRTKCNRPERKSKSIKIKHR